MPERYQVVVVGGGPVGMALAVELGQRGVKTAVIERQRDISRIPKGQGLTHRSLEHFYYWGVEHEIRTIRLLPPGYPIGGVSAYGNLSSEYWFPNGEARNQLGPYYFQKNERLPQYLTEHVLRGRAAQLDSVTLMFEHRARSVQQDDDGVRVEVSSEVWPYEEETIEADYAVGCDGTGSLTLSQIGVERHGTDFGKKMVLAVFSSPELHEGLKPLGDRTTYLVLTPENEGAWQFFGRVEVGKSFFFHAPVAPETTAKDTEYLHDLMQQVAGFPFPVEFEHIGFWNLRISVADTYRKGRIFIAGDAAHSHPPYGGYGLNSGLEDVTNLGWKLAAVFAGWGGDALLDSYTEERRPVFLETGEDVIAGGIKRDGAWLAEHRPEDGQEEFAKAWAARAGVTDIHAGYEVHYSGSPVVLGAPGATTGVHSEHTLAARAGHHLAPQPLSSGSNVFEELGTGFTLLAFGADDASVEAFAQAASKASVPLKVIRDTYEGGRENYGARMLLVRPDQFLAWIGDAAPADPGAVIGTAVGAR